MKRLTEEPIPPTVRDPSFPRALEKVVLKAMSRQPAARHRDAFHLLDELKAAASELPERRDDWRWGPEPATPTAATPTAATPTAATPTAATRTAATPAAAKRAAATPAIPRTQETVVVPQPERASAAPSGPRDTPVSLPPLAHLVPLPTVRLRDGVNAAAWWRFRVDAMRVVREEFPVPGALPSAITAALGRLDTGTQELGAFEQRAQVAFREIGELEAEGRQFRQELGRAIDELAREVSARRVEVEALARRRDELRHRRDALEATRRHGPAEEAAFDAVLWEFAAAVERLEAVGAEADDYEYQLSELRARLGRRNEELESQPDGPAHRPRGARARGGRRGRAADRALPRGARSRLAGRRREGAPGRAPEHGGVARGSAGELAFPPRHRGVSPGRAECRFRAEN